MKSKLFIPVICYNHSANTEYMMSLIKLSHHLRDVNIEYVLFPIVFDSLVSRARNAAVAHFLASDCSHLMFIDADIEFQVDDIMKLYAHQRDVCVGAYPKKGVNWERIKDTILVEPEKAKSPGEIAALGADYAVNFKFLNKETRTIAVDRGVVKLHDAGTGFMMIKRNAILKLIKAYPELKYNNDVQLNQDLSDHFYALFDTMIDPVDRRYLSEDYTFCRRWQDIGGDIWLDPSISLNHYGSFCFSGNPAQIIQFQK